MGQVLGVRAALPARTITDLIPLECAYLANVLTTRFAGDSSVAVLSYCLIDWGVAGQRNHEPDLAVFREVRIPPDPQAGTFDLRASGGRVVLTVEVVSPDTRANRPGSVRRSRRGCLPAVPRRGRGRPTAAARDRAGGSEGSGPGR